MILAIKGSPKAKGNLQRMLEKVARETDQDYEIVHLARLKGT
jgi:multimeric flavodoxin WrbA